ncbi:hypothetical protein [Promicromonospora sp. NPDC059942]|uniref:hypothetical protein n=1 Tax=Promicromonospora sp. NPDC059942 TaxID=3347009 RepID=UPI003655842D
MASYLLIVGDRDALGWILTESRTAFPSAGRTEVATLAKDDSLFLYTTRGCFKNPTRDRGRVIGTARVASDVRRLDKAVRFGERDFPVGCDLEIGPLAKFGEGVELQPLVESLETFGHNSHAWSALLRRPMLLLTNGDASHLRKLLRTTTPTEDMDAYTRWWRASPRAGQPR